MTGFSASRASLLPSHNHPLYLLSHLGLWGAIALGTFLRFWKLGQWPLAEDEYYLVQSVHNILESGLPRFECGGFYPRGLLQQYLTALLTKLGLDSEFGVRVPSVIANLAAIPAVYILGRRLGGWVVACTAAALFCLSVWEIEFARFGRMYSPFQTLFLWHVVLLVQATIDGRKAARLGMYILSGISLFVYEGAIFLIVLNVLPFMVLKTRPKVVDVVSILILLAAAVTLTVTPFRHIGLEVSQLPPDVPLTAVDRGLSLPVRLPMTLIAPLLRGGAWLLWSLLPLTLVCVALTRVWRSPSLPLRVRVTWTVLLALSVMHLFGFVLGLALFAELIGWLRPERGERAPGVPWQIVVAAVVVCAAFWGGFALATNAWVEVLPEAEANVWTGIGGLLLKYPDAYWALLVPWSGAIPILTGLLLGLLAVGLVPVLLQPLAQTAANRLIYATVIASVMMVSVIHQRVLTTRYSFFLYPLLLLLACAALWFVAQALLRRPVAQAAAFCGLVAVVVVLVEDFSFYHLRHLSQPDVNFRMMYQPVRQRHYYHRYDYRSAAEYVNSRAERQDLVISLIPVVDYYLDRLDYRFVGVDEEDFPILSACGGTREIWSRARMIYRVEDLIERIGSSPGSSIWIIALSERMNEVDQRLRLSFGNSVERVGFDERILAYRIAAKP